MSTGTFVRRFPEWTNADRVEFVCNGTQKIAQYCETGRQSCRNKTSPGVSLDKHGLTITNCTYNSWPCEARSYIGDDQQTEKFTVDCNQHAITSPSPGTTITSPSPGNNESHSGTIAGGVTVPIICLVLALTLMMIILYVLYRKVERFKQAISVIYNVTIGILTRRRTVRRETVRRERGKFLPPGSMV